MAEQPTRRDLIVVGASAGGVDALRRLVARLPADLDASVCIVLHVAPTGVSLLPEILSRAGPLPATHAVDGEPLQPGRIYVARPNRHLIVEDGRLRVTGAAKENGHRPAVDPLFRTAARSHGSRVAGVMLSGALDDGTVGLRSVKICGGTTLVQDPDEAQYPSMPSSAIAHVRPDYVLPVEQLAQTLVELASGVLEPPPAEEVSMEHAQPGPPVYTCPDCNGALEEVPDSQILHFRCKVGHQYTQESLLYRQSEQLESVLWAALRALEDRAELTRRVAERMRARGGASSTAQRYERQADDARSHAATLRQVLESVEAIEQPDPAAAVTS